MFTSRAEYRILLRQDNADVRLTEKGYKLGLASRERYDQVQKKIEQTNDIIKYFKKTSVIPSEINPLLESLGTAPINQNYKLEQILSRPQLDIQKLRGGLSNLEKFIIDFDKESILQAEILMKYSGYLIKEQEMVEKMNRLESVIINENFDFKQIHNLSGEAKEKLSKQKPSTLGQAARISGISPADVSVLMVHLGR
jgi:tRNA uridine 5-carboxymethylaminomethyl modification enzyme